MTARRAGIVDALFQRLGGEAAEDDGMDGAIRAQACIATMPSTDMAHVDDDAVTPSDTCARRLAIWFTGPADPR